MTAITQPLSKTENRANPTTGYTALIISQLTFAVTPVLLKFALDAGMAALTVAFGRLILATLILTPFVLRHYRPRLAGLSRRDVLTAGFAGLFLSMHFTSILVSLNYTTVLINQVIVGTSPLWVALLEVAFLKSRPHKLVWTALFIVIIGSGLIAFTGNPGDLQGQSYNHPLGGSIAAIGAFALAAYLVLSRQTHEKIAFIPKLWIIYGGGALSTFVVLAATGTAITGYQSQAYAWLLLIAMLPQLIGHSGVNFALGYMSPTFVSIAGQLAIVSSAVVAFLVLAERPQPLQILGSGIIIVGVIIAIFGQSQKLQEPASDTPR